MENLSSQLPTLDKYIGRIKRQQTEDKDCLRWDVEVSDRMFDIIDFGLFSLE